MDFSALPLFPLHTVLFPGGWLPLQVFELRYLELIKRCEALDEPFGVVALRSGHEVRRADPSTPVDTFEPIGTFAHLRHVSRPQSGLLFIQCQGGQRFSLHQPVQQPNGLWTAAAQRLAADHDVPVPTELASLAERLQHAMLGFDLHAPDAPEAARTPTDHPHWDDAGWLANRWAELLPIPLEDRQRLMALDNPLWRLELVSEWLERLEHPGTPRPA